MCSIGRWRCLTHPSLSQEREAKKETWKPRWFKANPGGPVFDGEHPEDKCPLWDFTGEALQQPKRPVQPDGAGSNTPFGCNRRSAPSPMCTASSQDLSLTLDMPLCPALSPGLASVMDQACIPDAYVLQWPSLIVVLASAGECVV